MPPDACGPEEWGDTDLIALYDRCKPYIELSYRSEISFRVLLLLCESQFSLLDMAQKTGINISNLIPKTRILEFKGLIDRKDHVFALTNCGKIFVPRFMDLLGSFEREDWNAGGGEQSVKDWWRLFAAHIGDVQALLRSSINVKILLDCARSPTTRYRLRTITGSGSPALTPRIRWLHQMQIIEEDGYAFLPTPAGKAVAFALEDFIRTVALISRHKAFLNGHHLERLPDFSLHAISDLHDAEVIHDNSADDVLDGAEYIHGLTGTEDPIIAGAIGAGADGGVPAEIVVSPELACRLHYEPRMAETRSPASSPHVQFFVTDLFVPMAVTITDACFSAMLLHRDGVTFDTRNGLYCTSPESRLWGERLFQYYKQHSLPISTYLERVRNTVAGGTP